MSSKPNVTKRRRGRPASDGPPIVRVVVPVSSFDVVGRVERLKARVLREIPIAELAGRIGVKNSTLVGWLNNDTLRAETVRRIYDGMRWEIPSWLREVTDA